MTALPIPTPVETEPAAVFAAAALGVAGHEVTDPVLRDILNRQARGEITGDQARAQGQAHLREMHHGR